MANQNNGAAVDQNAEAVQNQNQQQDNPGNGTPNLTPEQMKANKKPDPVMVPMDPRVKKACDIGWNVLKVAVPLAVVGGAVFLGINVGAAGEKKKSGAKKQGYQNRIDDLQRQLAERPLPALPDISTTPQFETVAPISEPIVTHSAEF